MKTLFDLPEKIQDRIMPCPTTGCWIWTGILSRSGYGRISTSASGKKRYVSSHRVVYERLVGPIPHGLQIDHLCRNTSCCNPLHLEPVTGRENLMRGFGPSAIAAKRQHCVNGHPLFGENLITIRVKKPGGHIRHKRGCRSCMSARTKKYRKMPEWREKYNARMRAWNAKNKLISGAT